jgi:hypothetical protein
MLFYIRDNSQSLQDPELIRAVAHNIVGLIFAHIIECTHDKQDFDTAVMVGQVVEQLTDFTANYPVRDADLGLIVTRDFNVLVDGLRGMAADKLKNGSGNGSIEDKLRDLHHNMVEFIASGKWLR